MYWSDNSDDYTEQAFYSSGLGMYMSDGSPDYDSMLPPGCSIPQRLLHPPYCPKKVDKRVDAIKLLQKQHDELKAKARKLKEAGTREAGYDSLYEDLYQKRYEIINGIVEVDTIDASKKIPEKDSTEEVKGVPDFWLEVLKNYEWIEITEADEKVFVFLQDIRVFHMTKPKGIRLDFLFECNPYFKNKVLTKTYHLQTNEKKSFTKKATGTEIEWYFGQSPMKEITRAAPKWGEKKPIIEFESCESFFYYFRTNEGFKYVFKDKSVSDKSSKNNCDLYDDVDYDDGDEGDDDADEGDDDADDEDKKKSGVDDDYDEDKEDEDNSEDDSNEDDSYGDESEDFHISWEDDCKIGNDLVCDIIPHAVKWYTGDNGYIYENSDEEDDFSAYSDEAEVISTKENTDTKVGQYGNSDQLRSWFKQNSGKQTGSSSSNDAQFGNSDTKVGQYGNSDQLRSWFKQNSGKNTGSSNDGQFGSSARHTGSSSNDGQFRSSAIYTSSSSKVGWSGDLGRASLNVEPEVTHGNRCRGSVKWFNGQYGFIIPESGGKDVFVHRTSFKGFHTLSDGERVEYGVEKADGKFKALDVTKLNSDGSSGCGGGRGGTNGGNIGNRGGGRAGRTGSRGRGLAGRGYGSNDSGNTCYRCGQIGHWSRDCLY